MHSRILAVLVMAVLSACSSDNDGAQFNDVTPPPPNQAPVLSTVADQFIDSGSSTSALAITVNDDSTPPGDVVLSARADNPDLLNDSSFLFGGSEADRTLLVTPIADAIGMATITILATDSEGLETETRFLLTVEQATVSFNSFVRELFVADANSDPAVVDGIVFEQDAENDDFSDLVQ